MKEEDLFSQHLNYRHKEVQEKFNKNPDFNALSEDDKSIIIMKKLDNHIAHLEVDVKNEFKEVRKEIADLKIDVKNEFKEIRKEMSANLKWILGVVFAIVLGVSTISTSIMIAVINFPK